MHFNIVKKILKLDFLWIKPPNNSDLLLYYAIFMNINCIANIQKKITIYYLN